MTGQSTFLSTSQASIRLGYPERSLLRLIAAGTVRATRVGRVYAIEEASIEDIRRHLVATGALRPASVTVEHLVPLANPATV